MAQSNETTKDDATRSEANDELRVTVFSASNLPRLSLFHKNSKAFVVLRALDETWITDVAERSRSPQWGKEFNLQGDGFSVLKIELKVLRRRFVFFRSEQLVGSAEVQFEELREKQMQAQQEDSDYVTFNLSVTTPSRSQPSISIRVHRGLAPPKTALDTARAHVSGARDDIQRIRSGPALPPALADAPDAGSLAQDTVEAIGSVKEVKVLYETTLASVEMFVGLVDELANIHPYVKAAWTILSAGYKAAIVQKGRDDALSELLETMSTALDLVCRFDKTALHKDDKDAIMQVAKKTKECALFIQEYTRTESFVLRTAKGILFNPDNEIARFKADFDLLRRNIDTGAIFSINEGLSEIKHGFYEVEESVKLVGQKVDRVAQSTFIDKLPYAKGAAWNSKRVCLPNTREALLEDIWQWINRSDTSDGARIFCLTGVAGSGKSAIAHTVARRCHEEGLLASSFFFSQDVAERSNPQKLLSTIARDLARDPRIREQISLAIEANPSIATASLSDQFEPLIREPCLQHPSDKPMVVVIDGLDEGYSRDLLDLFREKVPSLPQPFRFFVTSREMEAIKLYLPKSAHVRLETIDIGADANLGDIRLYIRCGFRNIARLHGLGENWPGEKLMDKLSYMAEGLFQWVSAILQALEISYDPAVELETLLAGSRTGLGTEEKMDEIYSEILQAYSWNSLGFKRDYDLVMGAILAAKSPFSVSALQALHPGISNINKLLSRLGALLTGWKNPDQPVRVLHLSLRDFLTTRAPSSAPFRICEKDHSQRLGLLSLAFLNEGLKRGTPGVGYLQSASLGIPTVSKSQISEELWYACEFWIAHVLEYEAPAPTALAELLRKFLSAQLISWMEICTSVDTFKGFQQVRAWIQSTFPEDIDLVDDEFNGRLGSALFNLSDRLSYMDRREEALLAIQEAVMICRQLTEDRPAIFGPDLARCLNNLSHRLTDLGNRDGAFTAIQESVALFRQFAEGHPAAFNPDLAMSLNNLSGRLSDLGQREGALTAIQESVALRRQLAEDRPAAFNSGLAISLNTLSNQLSDLGRGKDALVAIQESVALYRPLAEDRPATFNSDLAMSLNTLSNQLSDLGRREDALVAIQESVVLRRQLAQGRPAAFSPDLALTLHNLSIQRSRLGQREDALAAIQESVALFRQLAEDRPAAFSPQLASSLNNLSDRLSDLGQEEDALVAIRESVTLCRQLAKDHPAAFNPRLADSLGSLSSRLSDLGQREGALATIRECVALFRQLAEDRPAAFNSKLAQSLNILSIHLSEVGQREDALAPSQESVTLYRQLAEDRPAAFSSGLAMSLNTLSGQLSDLGRREDALVAIRESVALNRQLANDRPARFNADLAVSLNHASVQLSAMGQQEEALVTIQESVALFRQLAKDRPAAFNHDLAMSLNNLSNRLSVLDQQEDALVAIRDSVALYRQLADSRPAAFNPQLAMTLNNLSDRLSGLGQQKDALVAIRESVALYRLLIEDHPAVFSPDLARSLYNTSLFLSALDHWEEALAAAEEAVELYQPLANDFPAVFKPHFVLSLRRLSQSLLDLGQDEAALAARKRADMLDSPGAPRA
ncbi:hypothetical protein BOTBODRAFT_362797 [Botryobasidium botryosum FD-172 SS1]|uniref:C2 domain-containing protein n=1 Tax=Botryobasidium botryosum (strain FD-172 SS1) TaxID=930990 RepID=A0A067MGS5_BOTB1|nr:hypothetical protein BOTBODRAFT_362797 [Botryobasidium botryosum FD-172 SS1]